MPPPGSAVWTAGSSYFIARMQQVAGGVGGAQPGQALLAKGRIFPKSQLLTVPAIGFQPWQSIFKVKGQVDFDMLAPSDITGPTFGSRGGIHRDQPDIVESWENK